MQIYLLFYLLCIQEIKIIKSQLNIIILLKSSLTKLDFVSIYIKNERT
jgi:hypothetical protein